MEYLQVRIQYAKRDDKCIIWKCRVQKGCTDTFFFLSVSLWMVLYICQSRQPLHQTQTLLLNWGLPSAQPGAPCPEPPQPLSCTASHTPPALLRTCHFYWSIQMQLALLLLQISPGHAWQDALPRGEGGGLRQPRVPDWLWATACWSRVNYVGERSSIAKPCAHHSDTILRVLIAWFIYLSQKPCLQQWKWISLSLPALPRSQQRPQCIYGLNCNLHRCKKCHPWNQWLSTEKGILRLTWASNRHAAMAKQMSISPGLILSASAFFMLRA